MKYMESKESSIRKLIVMIRHGHRCPLLIPENESYWKASPACLTTKGAEAMHMKGLNFHSKFKNDFPFKYLNESSVKLYSSNLNRTVLSAYYFLQGMFNIKSEFEPVVSESEALIYLSQYSFTRKHMKHDLLLRNFNKGISETMGKNLHAQNENFIKSKTGFKVIEKLLPLLPKKIEMTLDTINYLQLFYYYDFLKMYVSHDLPLPHGFNIELYKELNFLDDVLYELLYGIQENVRLANYPLSLEIEKALADDKNAFTLISGHDLNVCAFLRLFNFKVKEYPFGACWVVAIHNDNHVEVNFCGNTWENVSNYKTVEEFVDYLRKSTYSNDSEYLTYLKCTSSDNILKEYREDNAKDIEAEVNI